MIDNLIHEALQEAAEGQIIFEISKAFATPLEVSRVLPPPKPIITSLDLSFAIFVTRSISSSEDSPLNSV